MRLLASLCLLCWLAAPLGAAERVVSIAPFLTDMVLQLDARSQLVGVLDDGQLSGELDKVARVGSYGTLSAERIVATKPDLVLAWSSGSPAKLLARLRSWNIQVAEFDPQRLDDIDDMTLQLGELLDRKPQAAALASRFNSQLDQLRQQHSTHQPRVFLQLWDNPLYTVAGDQMLSDALSLCGADNVFANLTGLAPQVGREGVLVANPDTIIAVADAGISAERWLDEWRRFPQLAAVEQQRLYVLDSDLLVRPTPAIIEGVTQLCELVSH